MRLMEGGERFERLPVSSAQRFARRENSFVTALRMGRHGPTTSVAATINRHSLFFIPTIPAMLTLMTLP